MQFGQAELQQLPPLRIVVACGLEQFGVQVAGHPGNQGIVSALKQWRQLGWIGLLLDLAPAFEPQQLSLEALHQLPITLKAGQVETAALFQQQKLAARLGLQQRIEPALQPLQIFLAMECGLQLMPHKGGGGSGCTVGSAPRLRFTASTWPFW